MRNCKKCWYYRTYYRTLTSSRLFKTEQPTILLAVPRAEKNKKNTAVASGRRTMAWAHAYYRSCRAAAGRASRNRGMSDFAVEKRLEGAGIHAKQITNPMNVCPSVLDTDMTIKCLMLCLIGSLPRGQNLSDERSMLDCPCACYGELYKYL